MLTPATASGVQREKSLRRRQPVPVTDLRTLVLNADYRPLSTWPLSLISAQDAISAFWRERITVVEEWPGAVFRSPSVTIPVPKIVALREYAPISGDPKFCRRSILLRDRFCCFAAGTRILMADGRQKPIEEVLIGDRVIDAFGNSVNVVDTGKRITDDCVSIKHRGSFERTIVTVDHPFLQDGMEFTPIGNIDIGDPEQSGRRRGGYLRFPRRILYDTKLATHVDITSLIPQHKWYRLRNGRIYRSRRSHERGLPANLMQSSEFALFLGLYVAEGSATDSGRVAWSFHQKEIGTIGLDVAIFLRRIGLSTSVSFPPDHTNRGCAIATSSRTLAEVLLSQCGKGARNKKTPWNLIGPFHASYLRGLFSGDAAFDHIRHKIVLQMAGLDAILGAQSMLWGLGIFPTLQNLQIDGKLPTFTLVLNAENYSRFMTLVMGDPVDSRERIFGDETHVYRRLQTRDQINLDIIVYNIETDGSHSYIANGLSVHNCQYCGQRFPASELTYDHVIPRSKGGKTKWENIVTACLRCNGLKGNKLPNYSGRKAAGQMRPLKEPRRPTNSELLAAGLEFLPVDIREDFGSALYWGVELDP